MEVRERNVWRVQSGGRSKWFVGEIGARDYASDRFDKEFDGVPWVEEVTLSEALVRLNELEDKNNEGRPL